MSHWVLILLLNSLEGEIVKREQLLAQDYGETSAQVALCNKKIQEYRSAIEVSFGLLEGQILRA